MSNEQVFSIDWLGRKLTIKTGKLARQANAAVTVQYGDTVVLATVVESENEREGIDFFPLQVEFEERFYAAGIIKGSRWIKREGRPSDDAILTGRMIDRAIRPLFNQKNRREVQSVLTVLSTDQENDYDIVGLVAISTAVAISGVEWNGPIGGIRVGRKEGQLIFNPTYAERLESDLDLIVAGTKERAIMIEAGAKEVPEDDIYEAILAGQRELAPVVDLIRELQAAVPVRKAKAAKAAPAIDPETERIIGLANGWLDQNVDRILFDKVYYTKGERKAAVKAIEQGLDGYLSEQGLGKDERRLAAAKTVETAVETKVTRAILEDKRRVDGRGLTDLRTITSDVEMLPRNHGAGLFERGETQILSIVTLGAAGLAQALEGLEGTGEKRYMHHYNFAPYSVGEVKPMRGPGRREIGHGALAEKALVPVLPTKEEFPYTIRVVSETLSSNGSSSMGSTCASSLALMDAGVPIKKAVAGLAIGLASNDDMSKWEVLTDIQDLEDGKGGMDFKITGTAEGVTAIQLDTKTIGLDAPIVKEALRQGREGRLRILDVMNQAIATPRPELSPYAPRITSFHIDPEKIREVIGSGGKVINKIVAETGVTIDIDDDGLVMVCGTDAAMCAKAVGIIQDIVREFKVGETFTGTVVKMLDFGAFVELAPGRDGMVHVSKLAPYRVSRPADFVSIGDTVTVRVEEIDEQGRVNLSMLDQPENDHLWIAEKGKEVPGSYVPRSGGFGDRGRSGGSGGRDRGRSGGGFRR